MTRIRKKNPLLVYYVLFIICFASCTENSEGFVSVEKPTHNVEYEKVSTLQENLFLTGEVKSFDFIDKESIVVAFSKPSRVVLYNVNGQQVKQIGETGRGPLEYQNPSIIRVSNNQVYVWDADHLKLIVFDNKGNALTQHTDFKFAIKDFEVFKDNICFYFGGGFSKIIGVYNLSKRQFEYRGGEPSEEHFLLGFHRGAGAMSVFNNGLIHVPIDQLKITYLDFLNFESEILLKLNDDDFKIEDIDNHEKIINSGMNNVLKYLNTNSYVSGLFNTGEELVLKAEVGNFQVLNDTTDNSQRFYKYYVFDKALKLIKVAKTPHQFTQNNDLFRTMNNNIYTMVYGTDDNNFGMELIKIKFEK